MAVMGWQAMCSLPRMVTPLACCRSLCQYALNTCHRGSRAPPSTLAQTCLHSKACIEAMGAMGFAP